MAYKALDVARYIINYSYEINKKVTNFKLQKLLYYVQAKFLVEKGEKCFKDELISWDYGPVVQEVYDEFKYSGRSELNFQETYKTIEFNKTVQNIQIYDKKFDESILKLEDKEMIKLVIDSYKNSDGFYMARKILEEKPCKYTLRNNYISTKLIKEYYCAYPEKVYKK